MINKSSRIYLAGHTGLAGSAIHRRLIKEGYTNILTRKMEELDLRSENETRAFFEENKPEYVFIAAAKVGGIVANNTYRADFLLENLNIQNNLIEQSAKHGIKKLIFLGSSCIYPKNAPQPLKEEYLLTSELEYTNEPYAIAKIAGIKLCEAMNLQYGTNFLSVMPTNLYGPNDNFHLERSHVFPAIIRKLHLAKSLYNNDEPALRKDLEKYPVEGLHHSSGWDEILSVLKHHGISGSKGRASVQFWGTGSPYREFMHSDDLAGALIFLFEKVDFKDLVDDPSKFKLEVKNIINTHINIGTGKDIRIKELAQLVAGVIGYSGNIEWDTSRPDGTPQKLMDVSKINKLGWKASVSLEEGVKRVYNWYLSL